MKKLLILGATSNWIEIVKHAQNLNVLAYVTDYNKNAPAKKWADKSFLIDASDVENIASLIKDEDIDGVITGFSEKLLPFFLQICTATNKPCYLTDYNLDIMTNKKKFKALCRQNDIPVVEDYAVKIGRHEDNTHEDITFPVLIKPIDNAGGFGITIARNKEEFVSNYNKSMSFSKSGNVLVEKYMQSKEATIFYVIQNGQAKLTAMGDRHVQHFEKGLIPLPVAYTFPSKHLKEYEATLNDKVISMFEDIGMNNGMVFIQTFIEDGRCVFYEPGYRLTPSMEYKLIEHACGYNPMNMMIEQAVYGESNVDLDRLVNPHFDKNYCNITFLIKPGEIGTIKGVEGIKKLPNVIDMVLSYEIGDVIPQEALGTLQQVVARVFAFADTLDDLATLMYEVHKKFEVLSADGEDMLLPCFDVRELRE